MKLLFCKHCGDVRKLLVRQTTYCECKLSTGWYVDHLYAVITGSYAECLGILTPTLVNALMEQHELPKTNGAEGEHGVRIEAFIMPHAAPNLERRSRKAVYRA